MDGLGKGWIDWDGWVRLNRDGHCSDAMVK